MSKTQCELSAYETHQWVRSINPGDRVKTVLAVDSAALKEAKNGPFWMLDLKDATGVLPARIWSPLAGQIGDIPAGSLVMVEARAERYREQTQLSVVALRVLSEEEAACVDTSVFMPASAKSPLLMFEELERMADEVLTHAPWRRFMELTLKDETVRSGLLKAPAARGIHHARVGGLLEHILGVTRLCMRFAELYPQLDRQALFVGAVCHDLGKIWELTLGLNTDYTDEGRLAGHIFLGLERLRPNMDAAGLEDSLRLHLQHLVLSHHGQYEFGSPRLPQTAEAIALHYADNMDAKMDQCRSLFGDLAPDEGAWSPFQRTLDRSMYRAPRTPEGVSVDGDDPEDPDKADAPDYPLDDEPDASFEFTEPDDEPENCEDVVLADLDDVDVYPPAEVRDVFEPEAAEPCPQDWADDVPPPWAEPLPESDPVPQYAETAEAREITEVVEVIEVAEVVDIADVVDIAVPAADSSVADPMPEPHTASESAESGEPAKTGKKIVRLEARQCSLL